MQPQGGSFNEEGTGSGGTSHNMSRVRYSVVLAISFAKSPGLPENLNRPANWVTIADVAGGVTLNGRRHGDALPLCAYAASGLFSRLRSALNPADRSPSGFALTALRADTAPAHRS